MVRMWVCLQSYARSLVKFCVFFLNRKILASSVLASGNVWRKALLAASLSGILAYISQDSIYRGEERLDRMLKGINTMVRAAPHTGHSHIQLYHPTVFDVIRDAACRHPLSRS